MYLYTKITSSYYHLLHNKDSLGCQRHLSAICLNNMSSPSQGPNSLELNCKINKSLSLVCQDCLFLLSYNFSHLDLGRKVHSLLLRKKLNQLPYLQKKQSKFRAKKKIRVKKKEKKKKTEKKKSKCYSIINKKR